MRHEGGRAKRILYVTVAAAIALVLVAAIFILMFVFRQTKATTISIGSTVVTAKIAHTDAQRKQGLSGTDPLGANEGMLFVYPAVGRHGIWMKDMRYSIDIIWLSKDKKVIDSRESVSPSTYPEVFLPGEDAQYVLEVPAGFVKSQNILTGTTASF